MPVKTASEMNPPAKKCSKFRIIVEPVESVFPLVSGPNHKQNLVRSLLVLIVVITLHMLNATHVTQSQKKKVLISNTQMDWRKANNYLNLLLKDTTTCEWKCYNIITTNAHKVNNANGNTTTYNIEPSQVNTRDEKTTIST